MDGSVTLWTASETPEASDNEGHGQDDKQSPNPASNVGISASKDQSRSQYATSDDYKRMTERLKEIQNVINGVKASILPDSKKQLLEYVILTHVEVTLKERGLRKVGWNAKDHDYVTNNVSVTKIIRWGRRDIKNAHHYTSVLLDESKSHLAAENAREAGR